MPEISMKMGLVTSSLIAMVLGSDWLSLIGYPFDSLLSLR